MIYWTLGTTKPVMTNTYRLLLALGTLLLLILFAGCTLFTDNPGIVATPPSPMATAPVATPAALATSELSGVPPARQPVTELRLWLPPEIGARTESSSDELASQLAAFRPEQGQGALEVIVEQKLVEGPGGILNYLQAGQTIAPSVMPDLVAVPTSLLGDPRARELFYPLDEWLPADFNAEIYPAPGGQIVRDGQTVGYPFAAAGLTHLLYNASVITETIPLNWPQFISDTNHTLVLPADSREGALLGLQFYLAEGGRLVDDSGQTALDPETLARALASIGLRKDNLLQSHQLKTLDEAWQYHQLGLSDFMWTRAEYMLGLQAADPRLLNGLAYVAVPGISGPLIPLTTSWAWAITTADPARQALAGELISFLTSDENMAAWSGRGQMLPARRGAMALLAAQNPYYQFAGEEMERARTMPVNEASRVMDVLGDAVFQVLTTDTSPVLIAEQAAQSLRQ